MKRLLIAGACALGSCAAPTANPSRVDRELGALAAAVQRLEFRIATEAALRPPPGVEVPEVTTEPDPVPAAETKVTPKGPPKPAVRPSSKGPDPIRELAEEVSRLRASLRARVPSARPELRDAEVTPDPPQPTVSQPTVPERRQPAPTHAVAAPSAASSRGRFQVAGAGQSAWQTVLDTHTGVIFNYRIVDGRASWVPITTPVPVDRAPR